MFPTSGRHTGSMSDPVDWQRVWWERLVAELDGWTAAQAVGADRFRVRVPASDPPREVEVVMAPKDWETWSTTVMGSFDPTVDLVKAAVTEAPDGHPYLVFHLYELHPSTTPELPPDPEEERVEQFFRDHPEARGKATWRTGPPE